MASLEDEEECIADETDALKSDFKKSDSSAVDIGLVELNYGPVSASTMMAETQGADASGLCTVTSHSCNSRFPILFERAAASWWNPRFDSEALEKQLIASSFSQTRRRFRYALGYTMLSCSVWCVFFAVRGSANWAAFVAGTAIMLAVAAAAFTITFVEVYRKLVLPVSLVVTSAMCVGDLLTFSYGVDSEMSSVGTFAWSLEIILLAYTLIPMPLFVCIIVGVSYSVVFEILSASLGEMASAQQVAARVLLHVCIHAVGVHVFVMLQVRERSTFLKVGQSLMLRRALQTEKQIKHNMIHSLMPPKVAEEVMKSREAAAGDDDLKDLLSPSSGPGLVPKSKVNGAPSGGGAPGSAMAFRTFHMDKMDNVSILFADIVGFTKMSSNKSADHLVSLLNDLFGRFDDICRRSNCEKISTLGDCYYCVSGCPEPRSDHAQCCVEMGLAMCIAIQDFDRDHNEEVNMRVGVHTGAVLCGIVGTRRFKFDVWSHDVTLANMMESEGQPGKVHVSDKTYQFIQGKYEVEAGEDVEDIRRHKELIECFDPETGKYVVKSIEKGTATASQSESKIKTWFIVQRLFDVAPQTTDVTAQEKVNEEIRTQDSAKVMVDGESVIDAKTERKDLSAVQLLGKRDNVMSSHEELNGEVSVASGKGTAQRTTTVRDDVDRQLIECLRDETLSQDYLYNPNINQCTLAFTRRNLEAAYRRHYADKSLPTDSTALTLALPSYSSLFDVILSFIFLILIVIVCFVGSTMRFPWIFAGFIGLVIQASILVPMLCSVCMARGIVPVKMVHFLSSWYPRHLFGILVTSLPTITGFLAFCCGIFPKIALYDRFYCILFVTTLLHYCNFTMLSSWLKSIMATVASLVLVILLATDPCAPSEVLDTSGNSTLGVNATLPEDFVRHLFAQGSSSLKFEVILDVVVVLLLIWFLNREIEISYRLCFHGDVEALLDRKKIQAEKEQADSLLHNIVPEHVAHLLKTHEFYSSTYKDVGIIFAKISNFDDFYDEAYEGGKEFLRVLNELMGDFEDLFDLPKYKDVEKIKTIGSCLMAASGLNATSRSQNKDPIAHLYELMDFACDLLVKLEQFNRDMLNFKFEMEIGFNYGEVTAGVVGTTKLLYDIWGDAVNVASRMYSTGVHGRIQVTEDTSQKLGEMFEFEYRGQIFVKGKGDMNTYLLVRKKPGASWS